MPVYNTTPWFTPIRSIQEPQLPNYSFGGQAQNQANTRILITNVALTSNVATITGKVVEGNIPVAGQTVSISGTVTAAAPTVVHISTATATGGTATYAFTANSGPALVTGQKITVTGFVTNPTLNVVGATVTVSGSNFTVTLSGSFTETIAAAGTAPAANSNPFNVTGTVASVGSFTSAGVGTFTIAITNANVGSAADSGLVVGLVPETTDAVTGSAQTGLQFAVSKMQSNHQGRNFSWAYSFPSAPAAAVIQLEGAVDDIDNQYSIIDKPSAAVLTAGGETRPVTTPINVNFVRIKIASASGGTLPTVVAKILG